MAVTPNDDAEKVFSRAVEALRSGETPTALAFLERALKQNDNPAWHSYLGYCIAKERGQLKRGLDLCQASIGADPDNPAHYLNLAKVHLVAKQKPEALDVLRQGMAKGGSDEIIALFTTLGTRKKPVIAFLPRDNFLNKYLGMILSRLGLR